MVKTNYDIIILYYYRNDTLCIIYNKSFPHNNNIACGRRKPAKSYAY